MLASPSIAPGHDYELPLAGNLSLYDPAQVDAYLKTLFQHVDWEPGQVISLLGIGEKGTTQEGRFRERKIVAPKFIAGAHDHLKRWAQWHVAGFIVPAVLSGEAAKDEKATVDRVAALTAIILDIDSGDTEAKRSFAQSALGQPTMIVASGGKTDAGTPKMHLYWLLNEPVEDVERVAAIRKMLAQKTGGDPSFGRATQVVRIPGTVHAKSGKASQCRLIARSDAEYSFDDLADIITDMQPMAGLPPPKSELPGKVGGMMDFTPNFDTATAALHRDVHEGGEDLTRWGEFSKVAGFQISEARAGRIGLDEARQNTLGWMLQHMIPAWPNARAEQEFAALVSVDTSRHGPLPAATVGFRSGDPGLRELPIEYFCDIKPTGKSNWLIRELLVCSSLALIYGYPASGKSFFALDLALRISAGWDVDLASVKQGGVIYVGAEGHSGLRDRVSAFRIHHGPPDTLRFALVPTAVNLLDPRADLPRLLAAISEAASKWGEGPVAVFIDTLAATFANGEENGSDMAAYINNIARLRDELGCAVCIVHHRPKDQQNDTPRGHGSLMGAMDTIIKVEISGTLRVASVTKQKDAVARGPLHFELRTVKIGDDGDEPLTSAVVEYRSAAKKEGALSRNTLAVLKALETAIVQNDGEAVSEAAWRQAWLEQTPEKKDDTRRRALNRGRDDLVRSDRIAGVGGFWTILEREEVRGSDLGQTMDFTPRLA